MAGEQFACLHLAKKKNMWNKPDSDRTARNWGRCSTFCSLGTSILRAFLIIGWGFSSSSEKRCRRGSNASWPGTLDRARSAGSGSKFTMMSLLPLAPAGGPGGPGGQVEVGDWSWGTAWPPGRDKETDDDLVWCSTNFRSHSDLEFCTDCNFSPKLEYQFF